MKVHTRRFAPRSAYAARYACSGRKNSLKRTKKGPRLIVSANVENAERPAAMLQENNPQTPHAEVNRVCTWYLLVFGIYVFICIEACDNRACVARMTNRHGHWLDVLDWCLLDVDGCKRHSCFEHTQQAAAWNVWLK